MFLAGMLLALSLLGAGVTYQYQQIVESGVLDTGGQCQVSFHFPVFKGDQHLASVLNSYVDERINYAGVMDESEVRPHYTDYREMARDMIAAWQENDYGSIGYETIVDVNVIMNRNIVTLSTSTYEFAGGAHGYGYTFWQMFSPSGEEIDPADILKREMLYRLNELLISNFWEQYENSWGHEEDYITSPMAYTLADEGLLVMYEGCCYAEGFPVIWIPRDDVLPLLKPNIKDLYK
jgi:hypothetical protein